MQRDPATTLKPEAMVGGELVVDWGEDAEVDVRRDVRSVMGMLGL